MTSGVAPEAVVPIEATLLVLAMLLASGRLIPRVIQHQMPTLSDWLLIASVVNAIGLFATDCMTYARGGMSETDIELSMAEAIALKKVQFAGNYFYDTGIYLPKMAILALYYRLLPPTMPLLRKVLYLVTCFTGAAMLTTCFLDTFWCGPQVSVNWSTEKDACSSFDSKVVFRVDWVLNVITDVLICALPFPLLHRLQLCRRQFWGLVATFSLGAITIITSVVRFATIEVIQAWTNVFVLSMAEMAAAIMVVSLPSMRAFIQRGGWLGRKKTTYGTSTGGTGFNHSMPAKRAARASIDTLTDDDFGSEVELHSAAHANVIHETRRISVQFSEKIV